MTYLVLDTCTILHILRGQTLGKKAADVIDAYSNPILVISTVTKAELSSFIIKNNWGPAKSNFLTEFLESVTCIDIRNSDEKLLNSYTLLDTYSQCKNIDANGNRLLGSARNMGKNDLWIAATALTLNAPLITADGDFDHLNSTLLKVIKIQ